MERRKLLIMAAASTAAMLTGAFARPDDHGHDDHGHGDHGHGGGHDDHGGGHGGPGPGGHGGGGHDDWRGRDAWHWRDDRGGWHGDHDRYWRSHYGHRGYIGHDRVFWQLRQHHYNRWIGDPYWFQGRYVIRTYNRWGQVVFVEIDPYTGDFMGEIRF